MRTPSRSVGVGDWVYSESPGIWQVFRILADVHRLRYELQERKRLYRQPIVFSKRLVDEAWRPAFATELSSASFVERLSDMDAARLERFIDENPETVRQFEAYQPRNLDFVMDLRLNVPESVGEEEIRALVKDVFDGIEAGLTNTEILERLSSGPLSSLRAKSVDNATLQFLCREHEIRNGEFVFRGVRVLF